MVRLILSLDDLLISGSGDRTISIRNITTRKIVKTLKGHNEGVWSVAFDNKNNILAGLSGIDNIIKLWNTKTGEETKSIHKDLATSLKFENGYLDILNLNGTITSD